MAFQHIVELLGGFANQKGSADVFIKRIEPRQAVVFCTPADNPVNVFIRRQRVAGRLGIGRLAVIDENQIFVGSNRLQAMGKTRKIGESVLQFFHVMAQCAQHASGGGSILPVMGTAQSGRVLQVGNNVFTRHQHAITPENITISRGRNAANLRARCAQGIGHGAAVIIIAADNGRTIRRQHIEKPAFGRDISSHVTMPVEVVGAQICQHRDIGRKRFKQVNLIRRQFQHINRRRVFGGALKIQHRMADIAAEPHRSPAGGQKMRDERACCRLAIGARDRNDFWFFGHGACGIGK